jgi:methyl-accepting chemotaxis protein
VAVTQLDQMTQQNAALVEESAAAAESLREQAQRLAGVVGTFRLGAEAPAAPAVARPAPPTKAELPSLKQAVSVADAVIHKAKTTPPPKTANATPKAPAAPPTAVKTSPPSDDNWETF